jgi:hypothetical protein
MWRSERRRKASWRQPASQRNTVASAAGESWRKRNINVKYLYTSPSLVYAVVESGKAYQRQRHRGISMA